MIAVDEEKRAAEWEALYERLIQTLDYWVLEDDYGWPQHKVYFWKLDMLQPHIIQSMQSLLTEFPDWAIYVAMDIPEAANSWPNMGLIIRNHEIVDGLQREYFPPEYRSIEYAGSRRGTDKD
jgi:hypothetical protein